MSREEYNPVRLAQDLLRIPSVTPVDGGVQAILMDRLRLRGFEVYDLPFGNGKEKINNFFARIGQDSPFICFAGHTDVVSPGGSNWTNNPFGGIIRDGKLFGRGAVDMKGGVAAFVSAVERVLVEDKLGKGSIGFIITGDEEGVAINGTVKILEWMKRHHHVPDFCLVGEPGCINTIGDIIKIGRRGSMNATLTVRGIQGHVAYPHRADNPIHRLVGLLNCLISTQLDKGTEWFEPSTLQVTSIDVGNLTTNLIPAEAVARLTIRFNNHHTGQDLLEWLHDLCNKFAPDCEVTCHINGEPFLSDREHPAVKTLKTVIEEKTGVSPKLDTGGGTSDARFITQYCPTAEFGLVGASMHKIDEYVSIPDLELLTDIYYSFLVSMLS